MAIRQMPMCVCVCVSRRSWVTVDKQFVTHSGLNYTTFCYAFLSAARKYATQKNNTRKRVEFKASIKAN